MQTVLILVTGLTIVIGGILAFRLHAFVALILAGLTVAALSPSDLVTRSAQLEARVHQALLDPERQLVAVPEALGRPTDYVVALDPGAGRSLQMIGRIEAVSDPKLWTEEIPFQWNSSDAASESAEAQCYSFTVTDSQNASDWADGRLLLVSSAGMTAAQSTGQQTFVKRLTDALGSYCGQLAILIVAASIIGRCLLDSGAADRIVRSALHTVGEENAPAAFVVSGFTLSIPVFFDTVFYLMIPLGKALRLRTGGNYLLYVLSIVAGGTMAHSLVPPTPGPLFISEAFDVPIDSMILGGCVVGLFSSAVGMLYAIWANKNFTLELPDDDLPAPADSQKLPLSTSNSADPSAASGPSPGLLVSLMPIVLPVLLIGLGAVAKEVKSAVPGEASQWLVAGIPATESVVKLLKTVSEKNFALLVSAVFAVLMYVRIKRPSKDVFAKALQDAVSSAGTIILVTAAGGAFGRMMRQTSVAELLEGLPSSSPVMVVIAAFMVTTAVRTAQGSSTVAMITAAGIFGGLVTSGAANVDPLYVALAVGCGSKPLAWMNDSGFWVITRMSGMTEKEGLKYVTPMTGLAGLAGLFIVIIGVLLFP